MAVVGLLGVGGIQLGEFFRLVVLRVSFAILPPIPLDPLFLHFARIPLCALVIKLIDSLVLEEDSGRWRVL